MSGFSSDGRYLIPLWGLAVIAFLFFLQAAASMFIPVVLGFLISYALEPVVAWLARHHLPRVAGTSVLLLTLLGLSFWGGYDFHTGEIIDRHHPLAGVRAAGRILAVPFSKGSSTTARPS